MRLPALKPGKSLNGWLVREGKFTETADSIRIELGTGSRRALAELPEFKLADGQAVTFRLKRYDAPSRVGWQAVQFLLGNDKGHSLSFIVNAPDNVSVVTNLPKRNIRRGTVPLRLPADLTTLKSAGMIGFYLDGEELYRLYDFQASPLEVLKLNPIFQTEQYYSVIEL